MTFNPNKDSSALSFRVLEKKPVYSGFFKINRYQISTDLFAGGNSDPFYREIFERGCAVAVLLLDRQKETVVLVEQFRPGAIESEANPWILELVAGMIEAGELPAEVARRETHEEAGCDILRLDKICDYLVSPGGTSEKISLYLGEINSQNIPDYGGLDSENEDIKIHQISVDDCFSMLEKGVFNNAMTLIAIQWLKLNWHKRATFWQQKNAK